ncbi:MAG: hypothetical protein HY716_01275 [Planctomycetes bacterium]|nr:hypothetical protein [Planctomycetota bacterium]
MRERRDDIPLLAAHFLERFNRELQKSYRGLEPGVLEALMAYEWRGNVRELEKVIERAVILGDGEWIRLNDLPEAISGLASEAEPAELRDAVRAFERCHIRRTLMRVEGDKALAARLLGISLSSLYRRLSHKARNRKVLV